MEMIAERLLGLRQNMKLTQQKLSKLLAISQTAINRYEHGETAINANALLKYADFFDVSADYILGRCDDPQGKNMIISRSISKVGSRMRKNGAIS